MWTGLRAWWYLHIDKKKELPPEVKEYLLKKAVEIGNELKDISPEDRLKLATAEYISASTSEPEKLSAEMKNKLLVSSINRLAQIPLVHCAQCRKPVFTHEAVKAGERFFCSACGRKMVQ